MRLNRVKVIARMAQLDLRIADVCERGTISRSIVNKARSGGSMNPLNAKRLAAAGRIKRGGLNVSTISQVACALC